MPLRTVYNSGIYPGMPLRRCITVVYIPGYASQDGRTVVYIPGYASQALRLRVNVSICLPGPKVEGLMSVIGLPGPREKEG